MDVALRFADGSRARRHWDGRGRFQPIDVEGPSQLTAAVIDPDLAILLDDDLTSNSTRRGGGTVSRLVERGVYAAELLLGGLGP